MIKIFESAISAGGFKLADMQKKIKKLYVMGDITEQEMDRLLALASSGVSTDAERPEVMDMLRGLESRIVALEAKHADQSGEELSEREAWVPWDGISDKYQQGAIVSHNGKIWLSEFNGQNVWEPGAPGTDAMWVEHVPDEVV